MKNVVAASEIAKMNEPGRYRVAERLYLQITPTGVRSWIFRYKRNGIERQKGLGPLRTVSLGEAKTLARQHSKALAKGGSKRRRCEMSVSADGSCTTADLPACRKSSSFTATACKTIRRSTKASGILFN